MVRAAGFGDPGLIGYGAVCCWSRPPFPSAAGAGAGDGGDAMVAMALAMRAADLAQALPAHRRACWRDVHFRLLELRHPARRATGIG